MHAADRLGAPPAKTVLEPDEIRRALTRIAHEILERTNGADDVVLLGIPTRGVPLARRLAERLAQVEGREVPAGSLDITMYRDDLRLRPARALGHTEVPASGVDDRVVVLVDDVLYSARTGRTTSARTCRRPSARSSRCCLPRSTIRTRCCWAPAGRANEPSSDIRWRPEPR